MLNRLRSWKSTLPPHLAFTVENLYALQSTPGELDQLVSLHLWHDQMHCTLYRISLPGFEESASTNYLSLAPAGWVERLRQGCHVRAREVQSKIDLVAKRCPRYQPLTWRTGGYVYECMRNRMACLRAAYNDEPPPEVKTETQSGFERMIELLSKAVCLKAYRKLVSRCMAPR